MLIASDVYLCGWRVQSEIPLPELLPWPKNQSQSNSDHAPGIDHPPDINIRIGTVEPVSIPDAPRRRLAIDDSGLCRLDIPGVCRFSVSHGREIIVDPHHTADPLDLRNYLFGSGLALVCHQRGIFPLHGSALRIGRAAVIFSGNSGAGKSTLAAALAQRGHMLLSDDVCALEETLVDGKSTGWAIRPAFPRVKLRPNSLHALFGEQIKSETDLNLQGKHHFRFKPVEFFQLQPVPLDVIYFLDQTTGDEPDAVLEVKGIERVALLRAQTFRRRMGINLGRQLFLNTTVLRLASTVKVHRLRRSFNLTRIDETIALLESLHSAPNQ